MLSADDILKPDELRIEQVKTPEWGGVVCVRELRADERDKMECGWVAIKERNATDSPIGYRAFVVASTVCDASGQMLFVEPEKVYEQLGRKGAAAISRLFNVACRLNLLTKEDEEELVKN